MSPMEGKDRVSIVLDVPDDVRMNLRRGVFRIMGELALGSPDSPIPVLQKDLETVIAFVRSQIPDVEVVDQDGTKILRKKEKLRLKPVDADLDANPEIEKDTWTHTDEMNQLYGHHQRWGAVWQKVSRARDTASKANRPSRGRRWPKHRISVDEFGFHYRGESLHLDGDNDKLRTAKELRAWRAEINRRKGR